MARNPGPLQTAFVSTASAASASAVDGANGNYFQLPAQGVGSLMAWIQNTGANAITAVQLMNSAKEGVTFVSQTASVPSAIAGMFWAVPQSVGKQSDGNSYWDWSGGAATAKTVITMFFIPSTGI